MLPELKSAALRVVLAAVACIVSDAAGADDGSDVVAAATRVLANADYRCAVHAGDGSGRFSDGFTLEGGKYTAPPSVPGSYERPEAELDREHVAVGDVDGDGKLDAVAPVYDGGEGNGVFWTANVFADVFGKPHCSHAIFLGDRIELRSIEIQPPDSILINMNDHGPDEGMAQRTMAVRRKYQITPHGVSAFQQLPGKVWTSYRPDGWSVSGAAATPVVAPPSQANPLGTSEAAEAIWQIVTLSAAGDLRGSASHELTLEVVPKPRRGDRSRARALNEQGIGLLRQGHYPAAVMSFRSAAAADPGDAEVLNNVAYALLLGQDYPAAAAAIVATLSAAPSRAMAWETLGQILIGLGRDDAAVGAFKMVVRTSSDSAKGEQRLHRVADAAENPAVVRAIRAALAGGTVVTSTTTTTTAPFPVAPTRRAVPQPEPTYSPSVPPRSKQRALPDEEQESSGASDRESNAVDPELAVAVINREFGRVCEASLNGWWWKTLKLDWTRDTAILHVGAVLAAIGKIKDGLYRGGVRYLQFPNDAGTYNVIDWKTGQKSSISERAPYYFREAPDEAPVRPQRDPEPRGCPPFTNTCTGDTCCPHGTRCCWGQHGGCCPENTDCCIGGCCARGR